MGAIPWGNVLIVIALGVVFIVMSWFISKRVKSADELISGNGRLGVAFGATSLLAFWITGNTVMAAPESAYGMGIIGALAYGFLGAVAVALFAPIAKRIHTVMPNAKTVGDFFSGRFDKKNYYLFFVMLVIYMIGTLMTQGIGGGLLLEQIFDIPYEFAVVLTMVIVMIYAAMGGFNSVTGVAFVQVLLIVVVVLIVPPIVYFRTGISPIYDGMMKLAPEKLDLLYKPGLLFAFAGCMMGAGEVFMDNTFWQRAYAIKKNKVTKVFLISGIGWAFVPVAVASLAFVALGTGDAPANVNQLAPYIAKIYGGNFVGYLFLVCVWSALASTIAGVLNSCVALFMNDVYFKIKPEVTPKQQVRIIRWATVILGIVAIAVSLPKLTTMLSMLIFLGVLNAAYIYPIALGIFWKKLNTNVAFIATLVATAAGYVAYFTWGDLQGVVVAGWLSLIICVVGSLIKPADFDWERLRRIGLKESNK